MIEVRQTEEFAHWLASLRNRDAAKRIKQRLARVQIGLLGDAKPIGEGLRELRIDHGQGYRSALRAEALWWSYCCVAVTRIAKAVTLPAQRRWRTS